MYMRANRKGMKGERKMKDYKDIPLLKATDIEVRVKQCTEKGAVALIYKTARVDYRILNELFGLYGWKCDYREIKGNLYCTISIYDEEHGQWVEKTNCGIESREDGEGNEKKGEASDSLKRAGFALSIGLELYSAPFIFLKVETVKNEATRKYELKNKYQKFIVSEVGYDENREINKLVISDADNGDVVFSFGSKEKVKEPKKENAPKVVDSELKLHGDEPISKTQLDLIVKYYTELSEERKARFMQFLKGTYKVDGINLLNQNDADSVIKMCKIGF